MEEPQVVRDPPVVYPKIPDFCCFAVFFFNSPWLTILSDTATVDYDSRVQARHIFRLCAMTGISSTSSNNTSLTLKNRDTDFRS